MAKIIGESDCTWSIKYNFLRYNIEEINSFEDIKNIKENFENILKNLEKDNQTRQNLQSNISKKEIAKYLMTKKYFGALGEEKVINTLKALPDSN